MTLLSQKNVTEIWNFMKTQGIAILILLIVLYKIDLRLTAQELRHQKLNEYVRSTFRAVIEKNAVVVEKNTMVLEKIAKYE